MLSLRLVLVWVRSSSSATELALFFVCVLKQPRSPQVVCASN